MYTNNIYLVRMAGMMIKNGHLTLSNYQSDIVTSYYEFRIWGSTESFRVESRQIPVNTFIRYSKIVPTSRGKLGIPKKRGKKKLTLSHFILGMTRSVVLK